MHPRVSADIIPLPRRAAVSSRTAAGASGPRLDDALAALHAALARQRDAVASWRGALAHLNASVSALSGTMQDYQGRLDTLAADIAALKAGAVRLAQRADKATAG